MEPGGLRSWGGGVRGGLVVFLGFGLCWVAAGERHPVFWNSSNRPLLWGNLTVTVRLNDHLDIICPHYEDGGGGGSAAVPPPTVEQYTLYLVDPPEFRTCKPRSREQIRWECDKPRAPHGPERFSEKFQRFTPFSLGKEFREGHSYFYISKPIQQQGEACLRLTVTVAGKGAQVPAVTVPTLKGGVQADDAAAQVLRSVGQNAAMRGCTPGTLVILLLLPLLLPQGL
ncbi:ephrin-A1-like [Pterocles gutturalis]